MIRVVAKFHLKAGQTEKAIQIAQEMITLTRKEEGCVRYELAQASQDDTQLVVLEAWESPKALEVHSASEHFLRLVPQLAALCQTPPTVETFRLLI